MPKARWRTVVLENETYKRLKKHKWGRQKDLKKERYSFSDFISYLIFLYEQDIEVNGDQPSFSQIKELESS
jgi:predicted CopG family antitoxin